MANTSDEVTDRRQLAAQFAQLNEHLRSINSSLPQMKSLITQLTDINERTQGNVYSTSANDAMHAWAIVIYRNALIKLRLIVENCFAAFETLSLLAATRYIFELSIWLKLIDLDPKYGILFAMQLLSDKTTEYEQQKRKTESEITFFKSIEKKERELSDRELKRFSDSGDKTTLSFAANLDNIAKTIDKEAMKGFCLTIDDAKIRGYGLQAHLLRRQAIPELERVIKEFASTSEKFRKAWEGRVNLPKRWTWKERSVAVGQYDQYDYIYTLTSRLLHASLSSIVTDMKDLDLPEAVIRLRYIVVTIGECLELAKKYAGISERGS